MAKPADRLERDGLVEQGRASLLDLHRQVEETGEEAPALDEINAEIGAARAERASRSTK